MNGTVARADALLLPDEWHLLLPERPPFLFESREDANHLPRAWISHEQVASFGHACCGWGEVTQTKLL